MALTHLHRQTQVRTGKAAGREEEEEEEEDGEAAALKEDLPVK